MTCVSFVSQGNGSGRTQPTLAALADHELPDLHPVNDELPVGLWDALSSTSDVLLRNNNMGNVVGTDSEGDGNYASDTDSATSLPKFNVGHLEDAGIVEPAADTTTIADAPTQAENGATAAETYTGVLSEDEESMFSDDEDETVDDNYEEDTSVPVRPQTTEKDESVQAKPTENGKVPAVVSTKKKGTERGRLSAARRRARKQAPVAVVPGKRRTRGTKPRRFDSQYFMA